MTLESFDWTGDGTYDSFVSAIRTQIAEPTTGRFSALMLQGWISTAALQIALDTECLKEFPVWNSVAGQQQYVLSAYTGTGGFRKAYKVLAVSMGEGIAAPYTNWREIFYLPQKQAQRIYDIQSGTGVPTHYFLKQSIGGAATETTLTVSFVPIPSVATYRFQADLVVLPEMPVTTAIHQFPQETYPLFLTYVKYLAKEADGDLEAALMYLNMYRGNAAKAEMKLRENNIQQDVYPSGRYSDTDLGDF